MHASIAQQEASLGMPEGPNCTGATSKSLRWCRTVLPGPGPLRQAMPACAGSTSCQRPKLPPPQAAQHLPDPHIVPHQDGEKAGVCRRRGQGRAARREEGVWACQEAGNSESQWSSAGIWNTARFEGKHAPLGLA